MKKTLFLTALVCLMLQVISFAQSVKLNNAGDPGSAMLEVNSTSKGILIPNVALTGITDATTIALPATSLLVYNTVFVGYLIPGFYYNSGTPGSPVWTRLSTGTLGDGSETKVGAGTNVTVTGAGTPANPYIVNVTEVDGDVTNEIQDLSISGNILKITLKGSATGIDLSPYLDNTDDQTLDEILTSNTSAGSNKITSLADPVSAQDAATKAYVDAIKASFNEDLLDAGLNGFVADVEGNKYKTIRIGTQVWMAENLRATKYNDGTLIPEVTDGTAWENLTTPAYSWYENISPPIYAKQYGVFYNYYTVADANNRNVCPTGWDVPTDAEWSLLTAFLENNGYGYGGSGADIGKSIASTYRWVTTTTEGAIGNSQGSNNSSGFAGLPDGWRLYIGTFNSIGFSVYWWSSTEFDTTSAWYRAIVDVRDDVIRSSYYKSNGFSVRCLRD